MPNKFSFSILVFLIGSMLTACVHKSVFHIEPDVHQDNVFQYCGGQQWGYIEKTGAANDPTYLGVFLEADIRKDSEWIFLNIAIEARSDLHVLFDNRNIEILKDGVAIYSEPSKFWIIRQEKTIDQRFNGSEYSYRQQGDGGNRWIVRKKSTEVFLGKWL